MEHVSSAPLQVTSKLKVSKEESNGEAFRRGESNGNNVEEMESYDRVILSIGERSVYAEYFSEDVPGDDNADCFGIDIFLGEHSKWVNEVTRELQEELSKMTKKEAVLLHILRNGEAEDGDVQVQLPARIVTKIMQWIPVKIEGMEIETEGVELYGTFADFKELFAIRQEKLALFPYPPSF